MAKMKQPNRGPDVAENAIIDDSITPDNKPTQKATPVIMMPQNTVTVLITFNCCLSERFLNFGAKVKKSSEITVAKEFKLETIILKVFCFSFIKTFKAFQNRKRS